MNTHTEELISAAMDGEPVDLDALQAALAGDEGRAALASFVLLRAASASGDEPAGMAVPQPHARRQPWLLRGPRVPAALAASLALVAAAAALWVGSRVVTVPVTTQVLQLAPPRDQADPAPQVVSPAIVVPAATPIAAPRAAEPCAPELPKIAKVVKFVPGVDWKSGS